MSSVPRFFVSPDFIREGVVTLPPEAAHHALRVLRMRPGEQIRVHDGADNVYTAILKTAESGIATATVETVVVSTAEPSLRITVAQALPKTPDKIEQVLQHGTEIGAAGFTFWNAQRSVARLGESDKIEKRLTRWREIVLGAAEQSGRGRLPEVQWSAGAAGLAATFTAYHAVIVLHEAATHAYRDILGALPPATKRLLLIVGPEGGLSEEEVTRFAAAASVATLGPRILRTETAALVALAQAL